MNTTFFSQHHELFQSAKAQLEQISHVYGKAQPLQSDQTQQVAQSENAKYLAHNTQKQAELCCMAMDTILHHAAEYDSTGYIPSHVQAHTIQMLQEVPHPDAIFGLLEDLALITRGHTLFAHKSSAQETQFLQAFENAGEWHADDGNIVSNWYWLRLPALAMVQENLKNPQQGKHKPSSKQVKTPFLQSETVEYTQRHDAEAEALHHVLVQYPTF